MLVNAKKLHVTKKKPQIVPKKTPPDQKLHIFSTKKPSHFCNTPPPFWLMWRCLSGCSSRFRSQESTGGSLGPSPRGQMGSKKPCSVGARPRACERATTYFPGVVRGWSTSSWRSWAQHLRGTAGGMLCAEVAALRVTLATPRCNYCSGG